MVEFLYDALSDPERATSKFLSFLPTSDSVWVSDPVSGADYRLLHVSPETGTWVSHLRLKYGAGVSKHYHSGSVMAFTLAGSWGYPELGAISHAGDFLTEVAGAVHSLEVIDPNGAEVIFVVQGAISYLDSDGRVAYVEDWRTMLTEYRSLAAKMGFEPRVLGAPSS